MRNGGSSPRTPNTSKKRERDDEIYFHELLADNVRAPEVKKDHSPVSRANRQKTMYSPSKKVYVDKFGLSLIDNVIIRSINEKEMLSDVLRTRADDDQLPEMHFI